MFIINEIEWGGAAQMNDGNSESVISGAGDATCVRMQKQSKYILLREIFRADLHWSRQRKSDLLANSLCVRIR